MKRFRIILPALFVGLLIVFSNNSLAQKIEKDKKTITFKSGKKDKAISGILTGSKAPYTLVDGVPMDIDQVNPEDIESVSVLKDAAASAIYGDRAPFGAILITTKRGKKYIISTEEKSSRLILKKSFDSESLTKKSNFKVEEDQNKIKLSISGSCSSGKIAISVLLPSKEVFKNIEIDPSADVEWSQTIRFLEEKDKYIGNWSIEINVINAVGNYYLKISAD